MKLPGFEFAVQCTSVSTTQSQPYHKVGLLTYAKCQCRKQHAETGLLLDFCSNLQPVPV